MTRTTPHLKDLIINIKTYMVMKTLRKFLLLAIVPLMAGTISSCTDYQDEINALDYRVTELEKLAKRMNTQLEALQIIADALENADYITNVTPNSQGYIITFKKAGAVLIRNGQDGIDGIDAEVPDISILQGPDGYFYWTLNGEFIVTPDGSLVRANGKDGVDGKDGKDGVALAPMVRLNEQTYFWEVSYDGGITWISTSMYAKGQDGADGKDAEAPEISMKQGDDGDYYWTINGTFILTPDGNMVRANGKDGKDGKDGKAVAPQVRINDVTLVWEVSYDGGNTWISTGVSAQGKDGADGKDAEAPEISAKQGPDGNYYWAVNGEFVVTADGEMIRANGKDGKNGTDGKDGRAVAPQVRINPTTYIWEISYDGGTTWFSTGTYAKGKDGADGKDGINGKDGKNGDVVIESVEFLWVNGVYVARFKFPNNQGQFDVPIITNAN